VRTAAGDDLRDLFLLRPDIVFLNHGSFGACPRPVFDVYQRLQLELERQPVLFLDREFRQRMAAARGALAQYLGADADDLVYVPNATTALNIVARSLPLEPGDEILTTDLEYGAIDRTWEFVARRRGARIVRAEIPVPVDDPEDVVDTIWARVTKRTRVLSISHIAYLTALILPIEPLVRRARGAGILTVIDGAHAPGQIPLSLDDLGADFYAGNCHKWMLAPKGAGFLHARRAAQPLLEPLVVSWGWESEMPSASRFVDHHEWQGTRDIAPFLSVPAAIEFMDGHAWETVRASCRELLRSAVPRIVAATGLDPLCTSNGNWSAQMAGLPLPTADGAALKARLYDAHRVEVPIVRWKGRWLLRISIQAYNSEQDVDALVAALKACLRP
jgi:isopenicillin-N epimerase